MGEWLIYGSNGTQKATVKKLEYSGEFMGETSVSCDIYSPSPISFSIGDYLVYRGERFTIDYDATRLKQARNDTYGKGYTYENMRFLSYVGELKKCEFLDFVPSDNLIHFSQLPDFSFYAETVKDLADRLQANLDRIYTGSNAWSVQVVQGFEGKKNINVSVSKATCFDALRMAYDQFEATFIIRGRTITIGTAGNELETDFKYGKGNGLKTIERSVDESDSLVTRLRAYGNTTNLPANYYKNIGMRVYAPIYEIYHVSTTGCDIHFVPKLKNACFSDKNGQYNYWVTVSLDETLWLKAVASPNNHLSSTAYSVVTVGLYGSNTQAQVTQFLNQLQSGTYDKLYFKEGINVGAWPVEYREYAENVPNLMAIDRLMLPGFPELTTDPYIDASNISTLGVREKSVYFDGSDPDTPDIHPTLEGMTAAELRAAGYTIDLDAGDNGNLDEIAADATETDGSPITADGAFEGVDEVPGFKVTIKDIGFDINDYLSTETATLVMKTGMCGGREFTIVNVEKVGNKYVLECQRTEDVSHYFPYNPYLIKAGDKFVLTNIEMPKAYIDAASQRLLAAAQAYIAKYSAPQWVYAIKMDDIWMQRQRDNSVSEASSYYWNIKEGDVMSVTDADLGVDISEVIDRLTIREGYGPIPEFEVVLRKEKPQGTIGVLQNRIKQLELRNAEQVDIIRRQQNYLTFIFGDTLADVMSQLDKKAETWYQDTDPSTAWTTDEAKSEHVGDLWMDTSANGGKKTYIYQNTGTSDSPNYQWVEQFVPDEVFDEIDGKAEIFVEKPTAYHERDMWIIENGISSSDLPTGCVAGDIVISSTDSTSFNKAHWSKKDRYTDDSSLNNFLNGYTGTLTGIRNDITNAATAASNAQTSANNASSAAAQAQATADALDYLKQAYLADNTLIDHGLILSTIVALRDSSNNVWSGISGAYDSTKLGNGIAAWYGGGMIDKEVSAVSNAAKSLFRFDGSGYVASGNLKWDANGNVTIQGYSINATTLQVGGANVATQAMLDNFVSKAFFNRLFTAYDANGNAIVPNNTTTAINNLKIMVGTWTEQYLSALGLNSEGGGGGGTGDVSHIKIGTNPDVFLDPDEDGIIDMSSYAANWNDAYNKRHTHSNKSVLDGITSTKVSHWDAVYGVVPSAAYESGNSLADKNFVNSSISTSTATFRGTNTTATTESAFLTWANGLTHDLNDYVFWSTKDSAGNTIYKRYKYDGSQWVFEYDLNNSSFTSDQWSAINSGITSTHVSKLNGIASGAQVNVIETVKVNGTALSISSKAVDITAVPLTIITGADDLKAIEGLSGTSGFLKKTAANTWALDTTVVLSTRKVSTGNGLQGGGDLSADRTISILLPTNSGLSVASTGLKLDIVNNLTTASDYRAISATQAKKIWDLLNQMFTLEGSGTTASPYVIKANYGLYTNQFLSALGQNSQGGSGGGMGEDEMWAALQANTGTYENAKINWNHIPLATTSTAGAIKVGSTLAISNGILNQATIPNFTADVYTKVTVDTYGRVTQGGDLLADDIPTLSMSKISGLSTALGNVYTKTESDGKYVTALGTNGNYLTYTKNGNSNSITVPYAVQTSRLMRLGRLTSANVTHDSNGGMQYFIASSAMTEGKPANDGHILHFHWDGAGWDSQLFLSDDPSKPYLQYRAKNGDNGVWGSWITALDTNNTYVNSGKGYINGTEITTATKLGTATVGSDVRPIYLNNGTPTAANVKTSYLIEPNYIDAGNGGVTITSEPLINIARANRLALLPSDQIIIEKTTDGGATWVDYGATDLQKRSLFQGNDATPFIEIPRINGEKSKLCGIRITITGMKYNVPEGTPETQKYNYWNSNYVVSTERYCSIDGMFFWLSSNTDYIRTRIYKASGASSNAWVRVDYEDSYLNGWTGGNTIRTNKSRFGGYTDQLTNPWNYRIEFFTDGFKGADLSSSYKTTSQYISRIQGFGTNCWGASNNLMAIDHLYTWDADKTAFFPYTIAPMTNNNGALGGSSYRWSTVFASAIDASTGSFSSNVSVAGNIRLTTNGSSKLQAKDTNGTLRSVLMLTNSNNLVIGSGVAEAGYSTYLGGNNLYFEYGIARNIGVALTSTGNVGIGTTSPSYKLDVNGTLGVASGITLTTTKKIYFGDSSHYLELDANGYFHFSHGVYSDSFVSALGANSQGGSSSGFDEEQMWQALGSDPVSAKKIDNSHLNIASWALAANKPSYAWSEITNKPTWIGTSKPTYTFSEITSKPTTLSGYGVLDDANGKYYALYGGTNLNPSSTNTVDLNTVTATGSYYVLGDSLVSYVSNSPIRVAFRLWVTASTGISDNYRRQRIHGYNTNTVYERASYNAGSTWGDWVLVQNDLSNYASVTIESYFTNGIAKKAYHVEPMSSVSNVTTYTTVGEVKNELADLIRNQGTGIGDNITVTASAISKWNDDSAATFATNVYSMIKIGGGYSGSTHGQWLLSSYNLLDVGVVGRTSSTWSAIKWLAWTDGTNASGTWSIGITGNAGSATKLQTERTIWGQSFDGSANVDGAFRAKKDLGGNLADWVQKQHNGVFEVGRATNTMCVAIGVTDDNWGYIQTKGYGIITNGKLVINPGGGAIYSNGANVGISTSSPSYRLHVNGTFGASGNSSIGGTFGVTGATTLSSTLGVTGATTLSSTLGVTGATTLSSTLSVANAVTLSGNTAAKKRIYFGDTSHYLELDSTGFHFVGAGVYSDSFMSALGANSSGGGSGTFDEEAMWTALGTTSTAKVIASSHIPNLDASKITSGTFAAARIPLATSSARGGVKVGYTTNGKNYAVQLSNEQMYVNVPWTDHYAWSDITDKPSSFTPSAHNHSQTVTEGDNRGVDTTPNDYQNAIKFRGLKSNSYISSPSNDTYSYLVGLRGWSDYSGGNAHELAFNDSGIFRRQGATTTWGNWYKLLDSGNYSSYALPLTGGNLTGSLAVKLDTDSSRAFGYGWLDTSGTSVASIIYHNTAQNIILNPVGSSNTWSDAVGKYSLIVGNNNLTYNTYTILHSNNYSSYALPLTGGTLSGNIGMRSTSKGYYLVDSAGVSYAAIYDNGSNLWIGSTATAGTHHTGSTYISAGSDSVYISRLVSGTRTNYMVLDTGNYSSYALPLSGGQMTGPLTWANSTALPNATTADYLLTIDAFSSGGTTKWIAASNVSVGKATADGDGNTISSTYLKLTGGTLTGSLVVNSTFTCRSAQFKSTDPALGALGNGTISFRGCSNNGNLSEYGCYIWIDWTYGSTKFQGGYSDGTTITLPIVFQPLGGNVGIGTSSPSQKLHVSGNILASGEVTASSDERLKTIVGDGNLDLRYIANAPNILFKWNNGQDDKVHGGSLAQYFLTGAKHFVLGSDKDYYSLNYGALATSMAISIAKEVVKHEDRITLLEKENARLKARVEELEERRIA